MNDRIRNRAGQGSVPPPPPPKAAKATATDDAARLRKLEDSRKQLFDLVSRFRALLGDTTLPENKTATSKEIEGAIALDTTKAAWDLNFQNIDEGSMTLMSLLLHASLLARDEINKLKFQNAYLAKQVSSLKQRVSSLSSTDKLTDEPKS